MPSATKNVLNTTFIKKGAEGKEGVEAQEREGVEAQEREGEKGDVSYLNNPFARQILLCILACLIFLEYHY